MRQRAAPALSRCPARRRRRGRGRQGQVQGVAKLQKPLIQQLAVLRSVVRHACLDPWLPLRGRRRMLLGSRGPLRMPKGSSSVTDDFADRPAAADGRLAGGEGAAEPAALAAVEVAEQSAVAEGQLAASVGVTESAAPEPAEQSAAGGCSLAATEGTTEPVAPEPPTQSVPNGGVAGWHGAARV